MGVTAQSSSVEMREYLLTCGLLVLISLLLVSGQDTPCEVGLQCVRHSSCPSFIRDRNLLTSLDRKSPERARLLNKLKSLVCNKVERKECGVEGGKSAFVLGGENTTIGEFPFLGLLGKEKSGNIKWVCGGAVINKWFVLSAGHCGPTVDYVRLGEWKVVDPETETECEKYPANFEFAWSLSGEERDDCERCQNVNKRIDCETVNRKEVCTEPYQDIKVAEVIIHPDYGLTLHRLAENDIMLVKLSRPAVYSNFVQPVCLPSPSLDQFGEAGVSKFGNNLPTVVGWGRTSNRGVRPVSSAPTDIQQKLKMPAVDHTDCLARWSNVLNLNINLTGELSPSLHLCAGGEEGKDSCNGDSGGPLMARRSKLSPWQLVGVVS